MPRSLSRLLEGRDRRHAEAAFRQHWKRIHVVELDRATCERAADVARAQRVRTLDALHLAAAQRVGGSGFRFVTYDLRQARAARARDMAVLGA